MKFLNFLFAGIAFVGCVSAMEDIETSSIKTSQIKQLSDLFGKTIIPEQVIESKYGSLKFNPIVMPDFSENKSELEFSNNHFKDILEIVETDDLFRKHDVAHRLAILKSEWNVTKHHGILDNNSGLYRFLHDVALSTLCWMIENNVLFDKMAWLQKHETFIVDNIEGGCFTGIITWNSNPVTDEQFYRTTVY